VNEARFLFYSHDGVGLGHVRRNLAIARALTDLAPSVTVLLATSASEIGEFALPPNVDTLTLPRLRKLGNDSYASKRLALGTPDIIGVRAALLRAATESFRPSVLLADKHPFGAGGELLPALDAVHALGGRSVFGLRDVLDDPSHVKAEWECQGLPGRMNEYYDSILVYGDRRLFDPVSEYGFPPSVAERTAFCGYVYHHDVPPPRWWQHSIPSPNGKPVVVASAGGGEDGFLILSSFLKACMDAPWKGVVTTGPYGTSSEQFALRQLAESCGAEFHTFVPNLADRIASADAMLSMGGYNSLIEAAVTGTPTVCVPRVAPRTEQLIRASSFARLGLLRLVDPRQLDVDVLRKEILEVLSWRRPAVARRARASLDLGGAQRAARHLAHLAGIETPADKAAVDQVAVAAS